MKKSTEELVCELERLKKCDEVLTILLRHHLSQAKRPEALTLKWHNHLCDLIWDAKGKHW